METDHGLSKLGAMLVW